MIINNEIADALIDERRRLAKKHITLDKMLKYMDVEDVMPVLKEQQQVEDDIKDIMSVLAILN